MRKNHYQVSTQQERDQTIKEVTETSLDSDQS